MDAVVGIIVLIGAIFVVVLLVGHAKGPPEVDSMTADQIIARMQSEGSWIEKYKALPFENRQGAGIKKQYEGKILYMTELQLKLLELGSDDDQDTLIPILKRSIELMKQGMSEEDARKQASSEYVAKRDGQSNNFQNET